MIAFASGGARCAPRARAGFLHSRFGHAGPEALGHEVSKPWPVACAWLRR
jgi:hypothetical protein